MIYLLFGPDTYRLKAKLTSIQAKFLNTNASLNLVRPSVSSLTPESFENLFVTQTLLGGRQLIVLDNLVSAASPEVRTAAVRVLPSYLEAADPIVIITETEEFNDEIIKLLNRPKVAEEFELLTVPQTLKWLEGLAREKQLTIMPAQLKQLVMLVGTDSWRLSGELEKLTAIAQTTPITDQLINSIVVPQEEINIFPLLDALAAGNTTTAHKLISQHLQAGEEPIKLVATIATQLRNLIRVHDLVSLGLDTRAITVKTKLHPFVAGKLTSAVKNMKREQLLSAYQTLMEIDNKLKTSDITAEVLMTKLVETL